MNVILVALLLFGFGIYLIKIHSRRADKFIKNDVSVSKVLSLDNELFQKIDKLIDGSNHLEHGIEKIYVGSHYWDMLPDWIKWDWVNKEGHEGLVPDRKYEIGYRGIKIILDKNKKYNFDIE